MRAAPAVALTERSARPEARVGAEATGRLGAEARKAMAARALPSRGGTVLESELQLALLAVQTRLELRKTVSNKQRIGKARASTGKGVLPGEGWLRA